MERYLTGSPWFMDSGTRSNRWRACAVALVLYHSFAFVDRRLREWTSPFSSAAIEMSVAFVRSAWTGSRMRAQQGGRGPWAL